MSFPKVLHINSESTWRGGERQISLLIRGLKERGIIHHLACQSGGEFLKRHEAEFPHIVISLKGTEIFRSIWQLRKYCIRHGIQILDAHSSRGHSAALMLKRLLPNLKVVVHRRVDNTPGSGFLSRFKYQTAAIDQYIAISAAIGKVLEASGVDHKRITVVNSAVPSIPESPHKRECRQTLIEELDWKADRPIIANVAYITEQKGHETMIRGLHHLKQKGGVFYAFIAGDGPRRQELEELATQLGLKELRFLGVRNDPINLLKSSDILAMPSNNEGLGTTILDALGAGLAVAATKVGGIPEIIQHEVTGLLSERGDAKAHGEALYALIQDKELRNRLVSAGQSHIAHKFSIQAMVSGNLRIYESLSAKSNPTSI